MSEQHFAYVPHHRQKEFEALGWVFDADLGYPHAAYASYYRWPVELGAVRYPTVDGNTIDQSDYLMGGA